MACSIAFVLAGVSLLYLCVYFVCVFLFFPFFLFQFYIGVYVFICLEPDFYNNNNNIIIIKRIFLSVVQLKKTSRALYRS